MLITYGSSLMSMPRAATSVQIKKRTSPSLNALRLRRRSSLWRCPAKTTQLYSFSTPFSALPRYALPPPFAFRNFSRLSQSRFVRQKIRHCCICSRSTTSSSSSGFSRFVASDAASAVFSGGATLPSPLWTSSVGTGSGGVAHDCVGVGIGADDHVVDRLGNVLLPLEVDEDRVLGDPLRELAHLRRVQRRREQKRLQPAAGAPALGQPPVEREDRLQIPRVQQPISLVEDEELHLAEAQLATLDEVEHAAGRAAHDVDAVAERPHLRRRVGAADEQRGL